MLYNVLFVPEIDVLEALYGDGSEYGSIIFHALYCRVANHRSILVIPTNFISLLEEKYGYVDFVRTVDQACEKINVKDATNLVDATLGLISRQMVEASIYVIAKENSPLRKILLEKGFQKIKVITPAEAVVQIVKIKENIESEADRVAVVSHETSDESL